MLPRLHPDTIEQVKQRADIVDVVSEHVVLKKQGKDFSGLCPFHNDSSPSFTVSPSKQFYYCFSCGAGGNTIKFLMELGKRNFTEVILDLAQKYQIPVETVQGEDRQALQRQLSLREQLYEILAITAKFYEHALIQSEGEAALAYLKDKRQLSLETIQSFQLGYSPSGWDTLHHYLVEQKKFPVALVEQAGLLVPRKSGDGYYDRFRDRIMIPIHDAQGRVIGFGGRSLGDEQPKYLNSPETELFDKSKTLYALNKAKSAIAKSDQAVVVEGYFDVIALHSAGVSQVVASLGTALNVNQVKQLLRFTDSKRVIFNFDADRAGVQAAERAIGEVSTLAYQGEVQLRILNLPDGKDPDEFLKAHPASDYQTLIDEAPLWLDWQIGQILASKNLKEPNQFDRATQEIVTLIGSLLNPTLRTHYIQYAAEGLSQGNTRAIPQLEDDLRMQVRGQRWHGRSQKWQTTGNRTLVDECEAQLLRIYLHCPDYRSTVSQGLSSHDLEFTQAHYRFLWGQIQEIEAAGAVGDLTEHLRDRCIDFPAEMQHVYLLLELDEKARNDLLRPQLVIRSALASMERVLCEKRRRHFLDLFKSTDCLANPDQAREYQQRFQAESHRIQELDRQRQISFT